MENNDQLKTLLKQLNDTEADAILDLTQWDWRTRAGMEMRKSMAKQSLPSLKKQYVTELGKRAVRLFITGPQDKADQLIKMLNEEGASTVKLVSVYTYIAARIEPTLTNGGTFGSGPFLRLLEVLQGIAFPFGLVPNAPIQEPKNIATPTFEALVSLVKDTVRAAYGDTLNRFYLLEQFSNAAIEKRFTKKLVVAAFTDLSESETKELSSTLFVGQPTFSLDIGEDDIVDRSLLLSVYKKIDASFTKSSKNKSIKDNEPEAKE